MVARLVSLPRLAPLLAVFEQLPPFSRLNFARSRPKTSAVPFLSLRTACPTLRQRILSPSCIRGPVPSDFRGLGHEPSRLVQAPRRTRLCGRPRASASGLLVRIDEQWRWHLRRRWQQRRNHATSFHSLRPPGRRWGRANHTQLDRQRRGLELRLRSFHHQWRSLHTNRHRRHNLPRHGPRQRYGLLLRGRRRELGRHKSQFRAGRRHSHRARNHSSRSRQPSSYRRQRTGHSHLDRQHFRHQLQR